MNEEKLSSDKVPQKFAEWLLSMGCPPDKVPSVDKLAEMCRGQYYMVWRSLMEHVEAKDIIRHKRLQVFHNDVERCQKKNAFCKPDSSIVVPDELSLWKQQTTMKERVQDAEDRVQQAKEKLNLLIDKVSSKLSHREATRSRLQDGQRRAWLLQQVAEELRAKKDNLIEAKGIADSLSGQEESGDVESKLDKLLNRRATSRPAALSVSVASLASSSITSTTELNDTGDNARITPQWVLSYTAAMHCALALEAVKCKLHAQHTQARLAASLTQLNECLSGEACELLVVRSERVRAEARVQACARCRPARRASSSVSVRKLACRPCARCTTSSPRLDCSRRIPPVCGAGHARQILLLDKAIECLSGEACELLVVRSERVRAEARVQALRALHDQLAARAGLFAADTASLQGQATHRQILLLDKAIVSNNPGVPIRRSLRAVSGP
ncbi:unnamed protein product [Chrysodeixis includens]|uniref:Uncharacterized protein n=1 Tax=Chrysodeixis includens TaxID=689277 RepID=A0A9N8Q226_CHRIL|nr:unnamed protein product [Chrysodeixis includens]